MVLYYPPIDQLVENSIVFKNGVKNKTGMYFSPPKIGLSYSFTMNIYHLTFTYTPSISNHRKIPNSISIERSTGYIGHRISYVLSKLEYKVCAIFLYFTHLFWPLLRKSYGILCSTYIKDGRILSQTFQQD